MASLDQTPAKCARNNPPRQRCSCRAAILRCSTAKSPAWLVPSVGLLVLFARVLTRVDSGHAERASGGIFILTSLFWQEAAEETQPGARY